MDRGVCNGFWGVLYTYLAVTKNDVSFVLVRNDDGIQRPIYYVSKSL